MTAVTTSVLDFWKWFVDETLDVFRRLPLVKPVGVAIDITLGNEGRLFPAVLHTTASQTGDTPASLTDLKAALANAGSKWTGSCRIRIADGCFIERRLAALRLPDSRARTMAQVDVATNTPFSPTDVHTVICRSEGENPETVYCLIKRAELDPIVETVCTGGRRIDALEFQSPGRLLKADRVSLGVLNPTRLSDRVRQWLAAGLILVVASGTTGLYLLADERLRLAEEALDEKITVARQSANEARRAFDAFSRRNRQMSSLRNEKTLSGSTVYAWERLSRALPDDSWLSDLTVEDGTITLTGLSASAAKLIPLLEADEAFEAPEFQSTVMKVPGQQVERFTLQMRLKNAAPES